MFGSGILVDDARKLAGEDAALRSLADSERVLADIAAARAAMDAAEADVLAHLEATGACETEHGLSTASWFSSHVRLPRAESKRRVRTAVAMGRHLPAF